MPYRWAAGTVVGLFNAVFRPSKFVAGRTTMRGGRLLVLRKLAYLVGVYTVNLALYAGPLTLAGFGVDESLTPPAWFVASAATYAGDPVTLWQFLNAFVQNCAFLGVATVLTFVTFHAGVILTHSSKGLLRTVHTVVYSTSAYLAGIFTIVWYLSTNAGVTVARDLVVAAQKAYIYYFIDLMDSNLGLPGGRPDAVPITELSRQGSLLLTILLLIGLYYLYSLYLGTRINHHTNRFSGLLVVSFVAISPALYVIGLIILYAGVPV